MRTTHPARHAGQRTHISSGHRRHPGVPSVTRAGPGNGSHRRITISTASGHRARSRAAGSSR